MIKPRKDKDLDTNLKKSGLKGTKKAKSRRIYEKESLRELRFFDQFNDDFNSFYEDFD